MNTVAFLLGYMDKQAQEPIRGYDPKTKRLDMKENLKGVYGKNIDKEFQKADAYAKKAGLPIQMGKGYSRKVHLDMDPSPDGEGPAYYMSPRGNYERIRLAPADTVHKHLKTTTGTDRKFGGIPESIGKMDPQEVRREVLRHEMAHAASMYDQKPRMREDAGIHDLPIYSLPGPNEPYMKKVEEYAQEAKQRQEEAAAAGTLEAGTRDEDLGNFYGEAYKTTYPETHPNETIPPLSALQHHLYKTTGKRIESPKEYDDLMQKYDAMTPEQQAAYKKKLPMEVQRFFNYRDRMGEETYHYKDEMRRWKELWDAYPLEMDEEMQRQKQEQLDEIQKLRYRPHMYDRYNRRYIPGVVQRQVPTLQKRASQRVSLITGNPKYISNNPDADAFYNKLQKILERKGYNVSRDPGEEYTTPPETDHAWIGHSRGTDRLRFAPDNVKTVALGAESLHPDSIHHPDDKFKGFDVVPGKEHYTLTPDMIKKILKRLKK
jgi:hypothetical protein